MRRLFDLYYAEATPLDKNWQPQGLGTTVALDALDMAAISFGKSREDLKDICVFTTIVNTNSPLQLDVPMAEGPIVRPGAPVIYSGFTSNVDMKSGAPAF